MRCFVAQPFMHRWLNKNSTVQTVWPIFKHYGLHFYFFPVRVNQKHIQFSIFFFNTQGQPQLCLRMKRGKKKCMGIFGRRKESQNFTKPWRDWILKCSESGVDRKDTWSSASCHCSRLWRDGQELAGSLRCHIRQPWLSGTGSSVVKRNCTLVSM